jgi:threonine/homoserine/homoserine lactone efflux protein
MTRYGLSVFALIYVLAVATPGPGVAAVIARSLGHGLRGAPAFIAGFFEIIMVIMIFPPLVMGGYAFGASRARRLLSSPRSVRWVQRGTGVAMASAAVAVATR